MHFTFHFWLSVVALLITYTDLLSQTLTINFSGIRNSNGSLQIQFFNSQENFENEKPSYTKRLSKKEVKDAKLSISYTDIKPGTYGVAILDDENNNTKMDYGLILPKEGFGFSDYYHSGMTQPKFKNFSFSLTNAPKVVNIKLRYL